MALTKALFVNLVCFFFFFKFLELLEFFEVLLCVGV
jgi:hypothetical protein